MAIALGARRDDSAKMVWSRGCIAYLFPGLWKNNAILCCTRYRNMLHRNIGGPLQHSRSNYAAKTRSRSRANSEIHKFIMYFNTIGLGPDGNDGTVMLHYCCSKTAT